MSLIFNEALIGAAGQGGAYEIEQSLRFDESARLTRSAFGSTTLDTNWTLSCWFKRGGKDPDTYLSHNLFWAQAPGGTTNTGSVVIANDPRYTSRLMTISSIYSDTTNVDPPGTVRDQSAWYHLVIKSVGTTGNQANISYYMNGELRLTTSNTPEAYFFGYPRTPYIGGTSTVGTYGGGFLGYMAEVHYIHGTAKNYTDFGEFDESGVWRPIEYTGGSYGSNGFYLKFDPSATNGIGHDHSGNGNNFTPSGFTTSGTGTDVMSDTPTTNWATLNPGWNPIQATYTEGNLKFTGGATHSPSVSSISASSGKFYFEATALSGSLTKWSLGIIDTAITYRKISGTNYIPGYVPNNVYSAGDAISLYDNTIYKNGSSVLTSVFSGGAVAAGDVVQMAVDLDSGKIWFGIDDTWNNGGGTEGAFNPSGHDTTFTANEDYIFHFTAESCGWEVNFGQRDFTYTPPTGFVELNTSNLPAPTIEDGSQNMMPVLWTGTGSSRTQTGYNFQPDLLWIMRRNSSGMFVRLHDVVRGDNGTVMYKLSSDSNANEDTDTDVTGLTSSGFTIGNDGSDHPNILNATYVGWGWKAGQSSGSSNTAGSITSTVSANTTAGFSIVSYTGTGSNATIGHGLGVAPGLIITKARTGSQNWAVYHKSLGATQALYLDLPSKQEAQSAYWQNTAPTSSVFYVGTNTRTGGLTANYIAYCFAEVEGYSKFGTYTGNANADGPFVYTGFKPAWVVLKTYAGGSEDEWFVYDNQRSPYNLAYQNLRLSTTNAENTDSTNASIDILSNGFKLRHSGTNTNENNTLFAYIAFASNPFGGSGVTPATAR